MRYKNKAITLVEIVVSIGVLTITIGLAATFIRFYQPTLELQSAGGDLRRALERARVLALSNQKDHGLLLLAVEKKYQLQKLVPSPTVLETFTLPSQVEFYSIGSFTSNTVRFNATGGASQGGSIILQNSDGKQKQIIVGPAGYISIKD